MTETQWSKEEICAVISQCERFPKLCKITLLEYQNKGLKMSKLKEMSECLGISDFTNLKVSANFSDGLIDSLLRVFWGLFY